MKKRPVIILIGCLLFSITLVVALYALSDKITHKHNNFTRLFPPHPIWYANTLDIKYNSYNFAGLTEDHIYLNSHTAPLHLLVTNTLLTDTQHVQMSIENIESLKFKKIDVRIDSPYFYLMDGTLPGLFRGKMGNWHADRFMYDSAYFVDALPISPSSFALRTISSQTRENVLAKETASTPHLKLFPDLLEKQIDGIFCTDGMFHYNKKTAQLVYLYYFRNQYIVMDTSLNLLYRGNTIDTNSIAKIKIASISSENAKVLGAPPKLVNEGSCVWNKWLFVHSNLLAKNEVKEVFEKASVIDVYDLTKQTYEFSFYIHPYQQKWKMKGFRVIGNQLFALYNHHISRYTLNIQYFPDMEELNVTQGNEL